MTSPPLRLQPSLLRAETLHRRVKDPHAHAFRTRVDYLLLPMSGTQTYRLPWLLGWNQPARPFAFKDRDHGERENASGSAAAWARAQAAAFGLDFAQSAELWLVTQVRIFGFVFNPVCFWFFIEQGQLRAVIAEVSNTFGEQHAYLCFHDDQRVLEPQDVIEARKLFYVSPFQTVDGSYRFRFKLDAQRIRIQIQLKREAAPGFYADLVGDLVALTNRNLLGVVFRRPLGSWRVLALIHWHAFRLWRKRAPYVPRPRKPDHPVSR